jgi:2-dehydropantoate 2-reductase
MFMRIAVFGVGGVGGYFGGRLAQAGADVVFIARGAHLQALQTDGLHVESVLGDFVVQPVQATDDPTHVGVVDAVLVGVKTWQVSEAAETMRPLIGPATCVVPLQNGVEAPAQLAAVLGASHAVGGVCGLESFVTAPGHIRHASAVPFVKFGELSNHPSARLEQLRQAFVRAGVTVDIPPNIQAALWMKFLFITPCSGIGAMTRAPIGIWRSLPETRQMSAQVVHEVLAVAHAQGIVLPADALHTTMRLLDSVSPEATVSMQRDIMAGRPSELEAQIGAVIRLGQPAGVATPLHAFIYGSLLPMERRARGQVQFPG